MAVVSCAPSMSCRRARACMSTKSRQFGDRECAGQCDSYSAVRVLVSDRLGPGTCCVERQAVIELDACDILDEAKDLVGVVGNPPALQVDVTGRSPGFIGGQQHAALEH